MYIFAKAKRQFIKASYKEPSMNIIKDSVYLVMLALTMFSVLGCKENTAVAKEEPQLLKALIIDGQNNHGVWPKTTMMMKSYLEETALFEVDIYRSKFTYQGPHHREVDGLDHEHIKGLLETYDLKDGKRYVATDSIVPDPDYVPDFHRYDVIVSNFGWQSSDWSPEVKASFEAYMRGGGGLVVVHAANNAWGDWEEFNKMIGVGGWGDRPLDAGNQIYINEQNQLKIEPSNGQESSHGPEVAFLLTANDTVHPIVKGLPKKWMHTKDELYDRLRGPAENVTVLYYAYSDVEGNAQPWAPENKGSGRGEPLLMTINYGKGRVFHTALGHMDYSMESVGFITTLQRGAEWAATGSVTQKMPEDFPTEEKSSGRSWSLNDQ